MKNIGSYNLGLLQNQYGTQPNFAVKIENKWYQSKDQTLNVSSGQVISSQGKIVSVSELQFSTNDKGSGGSGSITITMEDSSTEFKTMFDVTKFYNLPCGVYQTLDNSTGNAFLLFQGKVVSPISWNEGTRLFTFTVMTDLEAKDVGASPEEGYHNLPSGLSGKNFPLIFGSPKRVPAEQITEIPSITLNEVFGIPDPSIVPKMNWIALQISAQMAIAQEAYNLAAYHFFLYFFRGIQSSLGLAQQYLNTFAQAMNNIDSLNRDVQALAAQSHEQALYVKTSLAIRGGETASGVEYTYNGPAIINGITFLISVSPTHMYIAGDLNSYHPDRQKNQAYGGGILVKAGEPPKDSSFIMFQAGTKIELTGAFPIQYCYAGNNATATAVWAWYNSSGNKILTPISPSYWQNKNIGVFSIIEFGTPLNNIDSNFDPSKIYVDCTGPAGPSFIGVVNYLVSRYTNLSLDSSQAGGAPTDCNFALFRRGNAIKILEELSWQARCAFWVMNGKAYLKYLGNGPNNPVLTIDESKIEEKTIECFINNTENLVTKYEARWWSDYSYETPHITRVRNNVSLYGLHEEQIDFDIFDKRTEVQKSLTFWILRNSNIWKHVKFRTMLEHLRLDIFDYVELNFNQKYVANSSITSMVESINYNPDTFDFSVSFWVPVLMGEMVKSNKSNVSASTTYGLTGGGGPAAGSSGTFKIGNFAAKLIASSHRWEVGSPPGNVPEYRRGINVLSKYTNVPTPVTDQIKEYTVTWPNGSGSGSSSNFGVSGSANAYIGVVQEKESDYYYRCNLFSNSGWISRTVRQLQIDPDEIIPPGTWMIAVLGPDGFYMQVPVFLSGNYTEED